MIELIPGGLTYSLTFWRRKKLSFVHFSLAQRKERKETSTPSKASPVYGEDATAPPVALTLRYPKTIKGLGWFLDSLRSNKRQSQMLFCSVRNLANCERTRLALDVVHPVERRELKNVSSPCLILYTFTGALTTT